MAENKAMTTDNLRGGNQNTQEQQRDQNQRTVTSSDVQALSPEQRAQHEQGQQKTTVKALRTVHKESNLQGEVAQPGDTFETSRTRAAELRAHGIVEFGSESDEKEAFAHGDPTRRIADRVKADQESRKIPEQHKSSPLRNPKLEYAEPQGDVRKDKK